jgi:hypothetical protein
MCLVFQATQAAFKMSDIHGLISLITGQIRANGGQYALEMRITGNAACILRSGGSFRQEQEVCGSCSKPPAVGKDREDERSVFLVAAVAIDLAADFATGPAGAVNVYVSSARPNRLEQLIKLSSANAAFISKVSNVCGHDSS